MKQIEKEDISEAKKLPALKVVPLRGYAHRDPVLKKSLHFDNLNGHKEIVSGFLDDK